MKRLENVLRYLTARMPIAQGGLAMHAAGVLKNGKAYMFAGISRSGKSTVSALSTDTVSLGDDMGMVIRTASGWHVPALPFDNSEAVGQDALRGSYPLAGIWRLHQAGDHRIETPQANLGIAALTAERLRALEDFRALEYVLPMCIFLLRAARVNRTAWPAGLPHEGVEL